MDSMVELESQSERVTIERIKIQTLTYKYNVGIQFIKCGVTLLTRSTLGSIQEGFEAPVTHYYNSFDVVKYY